jgi:hypothetical protein
MGRLAGSSPTPGDAWIDETAPGAPERLRGVDATLLVDLSERPLPPDFGRLRRWLPVYALRQLGAVAGALAARLEAHANKDQWALGVVERPIARVLEGIDAEAVRWLPPPEGGGLADPFALAGRDGLGVLAELERGPELPALIVSCDATPGSPVRPVLPLEGHASYPFLIADDGAVFLLPEHSAGGRVQLFRADLFRADGYPMQCCSTICLELIRPS